MEVGEGCWQLYPTSVGPNTLARLVIGILHSALLDTRCKCRIRKASVSRFGWGSSDIAWYNAASASCLSAIVVARTKSAQSPTVISGSRKDLRKSLRVEHIVVMSTSDRFGAPLPFRNFSLRNLTSVDAPFTLYNPCSPIPRNSTSLMQWTTRDGTIGGIMGV